MATKAGKRIAEWEEYAAKIEALMDNPPTGGTATNKRKLKFHLGVAWEITGLIQEHEEKKE